MSIFINGFEVDVAIIEEPTFDSEVTEHPVEKGSNIADHQILYCTELVVEGYVSDTPVGAVADRRGTGGFPSEDAYAFFKTIRDMQEPFEVETTKDVFTDMMLVHLAPVTDTNDGFRFRATFKQLELVENERTTVPVATPRAGKKVKRGHKSPFDKSITPEDRRREEATLRGYSPTDAGYNQMVADEERYFKKHGSHRPLPFPSNTGARNPTFGPPTPLPPGGIGPPAPF